MVRINRTPSLTLIALAWLTAWSACAESSAPSHPLVGAIRWDAWYGPLPKTALPPPSVPYAGFDAAKNRLVSQDPGAETCRSLAVEAWRYRWPFFATLDSRGMAQSFNENRRDVLEREIEDAVQGGLDYWAFTAYPEHAPLSYTLKTFLACPNRDKMRFCLFVGLWPAYGRIPDDAAEDAYWAYLLRLVRERNYLKVEGNRPVIFIGFFNDALSRKVLEGPWLQFTKQLAVVGLGQPYLVCCDGNPKLAKQACDRFGGDALSSYATMSSKAKAAPYSELAAHAEGFWQRCEETGTPALPICMTGWDRRTRVLNPVSWESFHLEPDANQYFYQRGTPEEIAGHIARGVDWYRTHPGRNGTELVLTYAWNEFDEGGWLVPALPPPDGEGSARLDALRKALTGRKSPQP